MNESFLHTSKLDTQIKKHRKDNEFKGEQLVCPKIPPQKYTIVTASKYWVKKFSKSKQKYYQNKNPIITNLQCASYTMVEEKETVLTTMTNRDVKTSIYKKN